MRLFKHLREESEKKKRELDDKYEKKITHLRKKYEKDREKEMEEVPEGLEGFESLSVFNKEKFDAVKKAEITAVKYGKIEIDEEEAEALKLHPKMALPRNLSEGYMNLPLDISYTKVRWQLRKEEECGEAAEDVRGEGTEDKLRKEYNEMEEARTRMVYDSQSRTYDERKQRVTDLKECSRIFLPKPLEVTREAQLEMRRELHMKISEEYRRKNCDPRGRQAMVLTEKEQNGMKKLEKRKNSGEVVITMTDKSSKLCIMSREDYLKLGEDHVKKDAEVGRQEVQRCEKTLNLHSLSWIKMWRTGGDHDHGDRIRQSKTTNSENRADLYLSYKDHKKVEGKTRPIATGCTSNTLALSNSVSSLVESLANAEEQKFEVISTEDLIYNVKQHDKEVEKIRIDLKKRKVRKVRCSLYHGRREEGDAVVGGEGNEVVGGLLGGQKAAQEPTEDENCTEKVVGGLLGGQQAAQEPTDGGRGGEDGREVEEMNEEELDAELDKVDSEIVKKLMKERCEECGPEIEDLEMCLLGLDVEALFPSMTAPRTGEIVRRRMMKSKMMIEGFDWKRGLVYIQMNKHLTSSLKSLWKILPYRRKVGGVTPGMASQGMTGKRGRIEDQWVFKCKEVSREQMMEIVGRCAEIAIRVVFENFTYNFGGKIFLQRTGGPIGARLTMACSRVVMQDWGEEYHKILVGSGLRVSLLRIYVDDVRQASTVLRRGTRYDEVKRQLVWTEDSEEEDELLSEKGETADARMVRILTPVMNNINPDLKFTSEIREDFQDGKIPTLDCKIWMMEDWSMNHTYFEKEMRNQMLIPERSAISSKQKMSILSNEAVRRLSKVNIEKLGEEEAAEVLEHLTTQLKTSGYDRRQSREIIISGVKGPRRKMRRRLDQGIDFYRGAVSTLKTNNKVHK